MSYIWLPLIFIAGTFVGSLITVFSILWYTVPRLERLVLFRPSRDVLRTPAELGVPYDQCFIDTPDGARLSAWHLRPPQPRASILYFHGNGGNLGALSEILSIFYRHGLQVFAVDYRGYGWSTGRPTEEGLYEDAISTVRHFQANFKSDQIPLIYWGRSLGGSIAAYAAGQFPPTGLILETSFPSKSSLLEDYPRFRPFGPFSRCRFDTVQHLSQHHFPVLVVHGDRDRTVPLKQGQKLYSQLPGPKEFFRVEGAGHVDIHMKDGDRYMRRVIDFVESVRPPMIH